MKLTRRILTLFLLLSILACIPTFPAAVALESGQSGESYGETPRGLYEVEYGEAYTTLKSALLNGDERIPLTDFNLTAEGLSVLYETLYYTEAELFIISSAYSYTATPDGIVTSLIPTYKYEKADLPAALADFRARAGAILAEMPTGLSPLCRLLFLYDYLATHFTYDAVDANFDAYGMLVEGSGVCQAYSLLLRYLLRAVGIETECVTSDSLNHEWNIVKIGDSWYHLDVTWDDADDDGKLGQVDHSYFLLSDAAFLAGEHYATDWISPIEADDTRYDGLFEGVSSRFVFADGAIYAIRDEYICSFDEMAGFTPLHHIEAVRHIGNGMVWVGLFSGLSLLGGKLIYNTESEIRCYDPVTEKDSALLSYMTSPRSYIYGFALDGSSGKVSTSFKSGANEKEYAIDTRSAAFRVVWRILDAEYTELYFYGEEPRCPSSTEILDDRYRYDFLGWDKEITAVVEEVVYTAQYDVTLLYQESALELLSLIEAADADGASLYERYTALCRAEQIKDGVDTSYEGVAEALVLLDRLISDYAEDAAAYDGVFSDWVPIG